MLTKFPALIPGLFILASCGGGGGGGGGSPASAPVDPGPQTDWQSGVFAPAGDFVNRCAVPRTGVNPSTNQPFADMTGSTLEENNWLRSWSNDLYLWYDEIVDRDPALFSTLDYFDLLKTNATTASGRPKDDAHFSLPTEEWRMLAESGVSIGYGAQWVIVSEVPPRELVIAYTEPNTPATSAQANLMRGTRILEIDGVDLVNSNTQAGVDTINAGLFPSQAGETHTFVVQDPGAATTRTVTMVAEDVTLNPVQAVTSFATATGNVGYFLFNDHLATAEQALVGAVEQLQLDGISDLIIDVRYNGGGFSAIASQLAYMIAGPSSTGGKAFETLIFNDKHPDTNPVTGEPIAPEPFYATTLGLSLPEGQGLPTLNLSRVFVLTGAGTCSASESIINSLRGIDLEVIQVGSTTCGKPYGFYATDNCGTTYFSIQFSGVNDKNFGGFSDGFSPANAGDPFAEPVPGCAVADNFNFALGDLSEPRLAAALTYRDTGTCPAVSSVAGPSSEKPGEPQNGVVDNVVVPKPIWLQNRIVNSRR